MMLQSHLISLLFDPENGNSLFMTSPYGVTIQKTVLFPEMLSRHGINHEGRMPDAVGNSDTP
jgi:hypothetical protein